MRKINLFFIERDINLFFISFHKVELKKVLDFINYKRYLNIFQRDS